MGIRRTIKENWITRKLPESGLNSTLILVFLLSLGSFLYQNNIFKAEAWMPATSLMVLKEHQYWRLWTALFAHGDLAHILGNLFLFIPFAYFLSNYFSLWLFPLIGFLLGGLINLLVIQTLPEDATLIGVSGVVYWMGAVWMTLAFLIDRREAMSKRLLKVTGVSIVLFFPTTFLPEVSYLSHFLGYVFGVGSGVVVYALFRERFLKAEVVEEINEEEHFFDWENFSVENIIFKPLSEGDLPMLHEWLKREHVVKNCEGLEKINSEIVNSYIVYFKEKPIGYIRSYEVAKKGKGWEENFPPGVFGVDQFIADKNLLGKGIGTTFVKKFTDELLKRDDVSSIVTTPSPKNGAAIRSFKKAGFSKLDKIITPNGPAVLMFKKKEGAPSFHH